MDILWIILTKLFCHTFGYVEAINCANIMMTSPNGNIYSITVPLWGEPNGHRWIPLTKGSDVEIWCFLLSAPEEMVEQTIEKPDLRRHRAHYDVTPMMAWDYFWLSCGHVASITERFTVTKCAHLCTFLLQSGALWDIGLVHCEIS